MKQSGTDSMLHPADARTRPALRFELDDIRGYVSGGHDHGVHISEDRAGSAVTAPMCLNLEHYYSDDAGGGHFVPRRLAPLTTGIVESEGYATGLRVEIAPFEQWRLRASVTYTFPFDNVVRADFSFTFLAAFTNFEALVSNYFPMAVTPFISLAGGWRAANYHANEHRSWAVDASQAEKARRARPNEFEMPPDSRFDFPVDRGYCTLPIFVVPAARVGWYTIVASDPHSTASISANRRWNACDFSLVGRDVGEGETCDCSAWIIYAELSAPAEAATVYRAVTDLRKK